MASRLVAGIDSSTQSCKVVIRDAATGTPVRSGRASHPGGTEVDPAAWWEALGAAVSRAGGLADVAAAAISGQQHGLVALGRDGRVIRPALLWNDTRSADAAAAMTMELGAGSWAERTGLVPVASFTATKLRWLRDAEPSRAANVAAVTLPHDWLSWRLRGYGPAGESPLGSDLEALATDGSDASGTGYWSPASRCYDPELFTLAFGRPMREAGGGGAPGSVIVPRVVPPDQPMGILAEPVPLPGGAVAPAGLLLGAGTGDNAGAALGLDLGPGDVAVSLGTSGTVFGVTTASVTDSSGTVAGFADATGARLPIVTTLNAARVLDLIGGLLGVSHDELGDLATAAPAGAGGLVLVPYFAGERTPNLPHATASLTGMTAATTDRPHLARAAVEGMICALADGLQALGQVGIPVERLLLIGGAARSHAVRLSATQVFGRDIIVPEPGEYTSAGAAAQAAWVLTGTRPRWAVRSATAPADPHPEILTAYRQATRQYQR